MFVHNPRGWCEVFMDDGKVHADSGVGFFFAVEQGEKADEARAGRLVCLIKSLPGKGSHDPVE